MNDLAGSVLDYQALQMEVAGIPWREADGMIEALHADGQWVPVPLDRAMACVLIGAAAGTMFNALSHG